MTSWLVAGLRLSAFAGLINPIAIAYAVLRIRDRAARARRFLMISVLICIPITWLSLYIFCDAGDLCPYVGHVAWIAGLLLMIFGDIRSSLPCFWRGKGS